MDKPTTQQVKEYADSIGFDLDVEHFLNYYDAIGWVYGSGKNRKPIVSWEACVRTWKKRAVKRQNQVQGDAETLMKELFRPMFQPTVFVQCVKGPTTGRYLPIILRDSHLKDMPDEQYITAGENMCRNLSQNDDTEWVVRSDITERQLMRERAAFYADKIDFAKKNFKKPKKKGPLAMSKEIRKQIKEIKDAFHHPSSSTDGNVPRDGHI